MNLKKFVLISFFNVIVIMACAQNNKLSVETCYKNSYSRLSSNYLNLSLGVNLIPQVSISIYGGNFFNNRVCGYNLGFYTRVYPIMFFNSSKKRIDAYLKADYGFMKYWVKEVDFSHGINGYGVYAGLELHLVHDFNLMLEVGKGDLYDYLVGIKYDLW